jgi:Putative Flp pilus-assembly TadE/G-like
MHNLLHCRRGSAAFATVVALVPLIGVVALGGEAGSWYVTKQHAQNAADAAAYSGGLRLACSVAGQTGVLCNDTNSVDYRGKEFAAQNAFCNAGDTSYPNSQCLTSLPSGTSRTVQIAVNGNFVTATVSQQQPVYLAAVLGLSTVTIGATATAEVVKLANPCILALRDPLSFQGSPTVHAPNCGLASNSPASNSIDFTGNNGINVSDVGSISGQGGCSQTGGTQCSMAITYAPPVPDPLSGLNSAMSSLTTASFSGSQCGTTTQPTAYDAGHPCYNQVGNGANRFNFGNQSYPLNGVYFFSGNLTINGNANITGTATLILLPGSTLTINGNPTIQITAPDSVTTAQVPAALASVVNLMSKLLIYDPETTSAGVRITGSSTSYFNGITYVPNSDVTYQGNTTQNYSCVEVIAKGVTLSGNSQLDNSGCPASVTPRSQYVRLVQ